MDGDRKWYELTWAERAVIRDRRAVEDEVTAKREAIAKRESDEVHAEHERPRTRGDCVDGPRPCAWISCRYHTYLEVNRNTGKIKLAFPDKEPWDLEHSCALDLADRGGMTLTEVGEALNVTRERVRQIELSGSKTVKMWRSLLT